MMSDPLLFFVALVALVSHTVFLALWLRVPVRRWVVSTVILLVALSLLPPAGFSSVLVSLLAIGSCASNWFVLRQTSKSLLTVSRTTQQGVDTGHGEITPFPAIQNGQPANDYEGLARSDDDAEVTYSREGHSTKRPSSKRTRKKGRKGKQKRTGSGFSTSDLPPAEKPTIEEYLRPREDFFNDR